MLPQVIGNVILSPPSGFRSNRPRRSGKSPTVVRRRRLELFVGVLLRRRLLVTDGPQPLVQFDGRNNRDGEGGGGDPCRR